jgi:hypothetical protein
MRKTKVAFIILTLSLITLTSLTPSAFASTELVNYTGMTTNEINNFIGLCADQGFTEITLRLRAMYDWSNEAPSASEVTKAKQIISAANAAGIDVNLDMHTWWTTWDNYFDDNARGYAANRAKYLNYVTAAIEAFVGYDIKAWMVLNEPQYQTASTSENNFIRDVINTAKAATNQPVSVRFMGGASPTTGHYASSLDEACDFISRTVYWDPRYPEIRVNGITEAKMNAVIAYAKNNNKELWIVEFGKSKSNLNAQADYVRAFVDYAIDKGIDGIFCWVSQPEGGASEKYNIFDGYTPNPAFYELAEFAGSQGSVSSDSSSSNSVSGQSSADSQTDSSSSYSRYSSRSSYSRYSSSRSSYTSHYSRRR